MTLDLIVTLAAAFMFVALLAGFGVSALFSAVSPERRRLRQMAVAAAGSGRGRGVQLVDTVDPRLKRIPGVPKSPKEMGRLRRRLARAGYTRRPRYRDLRRCNHGDADRFWVAVDVVPGLGAG